MVTADQVLDYIRQAGPVLPKHVADAFSVSTLFASAFLSELSSKDAVRTSHLKIGGSPLYYTDEHRDRLVDYRGNLHEKEQKTFELLRSEKVLDDSRSDLLDRVALRKMSDFAVALAVDVGGERRIFWKYYLADDREVSELINRMLAREAAAPRSESTEEPAADPEAGGPEVALTDAVERDSPPVEPSEQAPERTSDAPSAEGSASARSANHAEEPTPQAMSDERSEVPESSGPEAALTQPRTRPQRQKTIEGTKPEPVSIRHAPDASELLEGDTLGDAVLAYFSERDIAVLYAEIGRKNSACFGVCRVPSAVGEVEYYFFAKNKKSITDKDIKEAYAESSIYGYPLLYLAKGSVNKAASELVGSKIKGCVIVEL